MAPAEGGSDPANMASSPTCWLLVHEMGDSGATTLASSLQDLARPQGIAVRAMTTQMLVTLTVWRLGVQAKGMSCTLDTPRLSLFAGQPPDRSQASTVIERLSAVIFRSTALGLAPGVPDAEYKSAEWTALLQAWLHGLPCPVLNRPRCQHSALEGPSMARSRQAAARCGLPIIESANQALPGISLQYLVIGKHCFDRGGQQLQSVRARALVDATQTLGYDLLAWSGRAEGGGRWRLSHALPNPDLREFGPGALKGLAGWLAASA